jgi:hypothetical protein
MERERGRRCGGAAKHANFGGGVKHRGLEGCEIRWWMLDGKSWVEQVKVGRGKWDARACQVNEEVGEKKYDDVIIVEGRVKEEEWIWGGGGGGNRKRSKAPVFEIFFWNKEKYK